MLLNGVLSVFFDLLGFLFSLLPEVDIEVSFTVMDTFIDILGGVLYFFPVKQILPILVIISALQAFRVTISLVRLIIEFLPFF